MRGLGEPFGIDPGDPPDELRDDELWAHEQLDEPDELVIGDCDAVIRTRRAGVVRYVGCLRDAGHPDLHRAVLDDVELSW